MPKRKPTTQSSINVGTFVHFLPLSTHQLTHRNLTNPTDRRLAQQTAILKERNSALLKAAGSIGGGGSRSTAGGGE
jgi:hypothetical protein